MLDKTIGIRIKNGYRVLDTKEIVRCWSTGNYIQIGLVNGEVLSLCKRLKEIESILPGKVFLRVHNSHLVNRRHVRLWEQTEVSRLCLSDGSKVPVARLRRREVKAWLGI